MLQDYHISPYGIGTTSFLCPQKILEVIDETKAKFLERYIIPVVCQGQELTDVFADSTVAGVSTLCSAVPHLLFKFGVVLLEEFQQGFLLHSDSEVGVFQFFGGNIAVRLHQLLITAVYVHTNTVDGDIDFLRFHTLSQCPVVFHIPQAERNIRLAAELFDLAVHSQTAHQRQVPVGFFAAFLHVK